MMVTLNSRINIAKRESESTDYSTSSNSEVRRRLDSSHGDITVTQEQWTTPPASQAQKLNNSVRGVGQAADSNSVHAV